MFSNVFFQKVCHGDEIVYVYHDSGAPFPWVFGPQDLSLAAKVGQYWAGLAHTGNPNSFIKPELEWPNWTSENLININLNLTVSLVKNNRAQKCDLFDSIGYLSERHGPLRRMRRRE